MNNRVQAGQEAVNKLEAAGLPISTAVWVRPKESDRWSLFIATPKVQKLGPIEVYRFIEKSLKGWQSTFPATDIIPVNTTNHYANIIARAFASTIKPAHLENVSVRNLDLRDIWILKTSSDTKSTRPHRKKQASK